MEHVTQLEIQSFILEACMAYPELSESDAVVRLALEEGRAAYKRLGLSGAEERKAKAREFRDKI